MVLIGGFVDDEYIIITFILMSSILQSWKEPISLGFGSNKRTCTAS